MTTLANVRGLELCADRATITLFDDGSHHHDLDVADAAELRRGLDVALSLRTGKPRPDACLRSYLEVLGEFAKYPDSGKGTVAALSYATLGLCGESGEVAEKLKKCMRDGAGTVSSDLRDAISLELGDVLWYWLRLCVELGLDPDDVATRNLEKLQSRSRRGVLGGSGDKR